MKTRHHLSKAILPAMLVITLLLSLLTGCATTEVSSAEEEKQETKASLNELEELLYDNLIEISNSFHNPASMKLLDVVAYSEGSTLAEEGSKIQCSDIVLVRLQGENLTGGTVSNYYVICLKENEMGETLRNYAEIARTYNPAKDLLKGFGGKEGEYYNLGATEPALDATSALGPFTDEYFDEKKINEKLDDYWARKGF